jgi:hypothetical protein
VVMSRRKESGCGGLRFGWRGGGTNLWGKPPLLVSWFPGIGNETNHTEAPRRDGAQVYLSAQTSRLWGTTSLLFSYR